MTTSKQLCLQLNEFQSNISTSFQELRETKDFCDVTLACDDDQQIEAHKVVLAACSSFFKNIIRKNKNSHPLLYMRGISRHDLMKVIDFIYNGEVNIFQEDLERFMAIAKDLKLSGLTGDDSPDISKNLPNKQFKSTDIKEPKGKVQLESSFSSEVLHGSSIEEDLVEVDIQDFQSSDKNESDLEGMMEISYTGSETGLGFSKDSKTSSLNYKDLIIKNGSDFQCNTCGISKPDRSNMRRHVKTHFEEVDMAKIAIEEVQSTESLVSNQDKTIRQEMVR